MNHKIGSLTLILLLIGCQISAAWQRHSGPTPMKPDPAPQASDLTAAQLIARYHAAQGGEPKLKGIHSVKLTGTWVTNQGASSPVTVIIAPGRYLRRIDQPGSGGPPSVKAVDGPTAWEISPQLGIVKPTPMVARDAARYRRLADPQGPLVNAQAKGNKVEVVGKMTWQDSQVYKLKVTFRDGSISYLYLDAKSFLLVRVVDKLYLQQLNKDIDLEHVYQSYRDVGGVKWPFTEKVSAPEANFTQTTTWKTIEVNKPLDPAAFKAPR